MELDTPRKNCIAHRLNDEDIEEKLCCDCKNWKSLDNYNNAKSWDNYYKRCKQCVKKYADDHKEQKKQWQEENKKKTQDRQRIYREKNKEQIAKRAAEYSKNNREKLNEKNRQKRLNNEEYRLVSNMRARIPFALAGATKSASTMELIGCTVDFLKDHLEFQFADGMTWENYGNCWHVDHRIPCASFNMLDPIEQRICFHYSNLQPLWAEDNLKKGDTVIDIDIDELRYRLTPEIVKRLQGQKDLEEKQQEQELIRLEYEELAKQERDYKEALKEFDKLCKELEKEDESPKVIVVKQYAYDSSKQGGENLKAFLATDAGKANKKASHVNRSETMRVAREQLRAVTVSKVCKRCNQEKSAERFAKKSAAKDGLQSYCSICISIIKQERRAAK